MSYLYNRRRPYGQKGVVRPGSDQPTLADYEALVKAYQELKQQNEQQKKELHNATGELEIKTEALQRQGKELKNLEAELVFTRAGLEEAQRRLEEDDNQSWQEKYARLQAELENFRKRWELRSEQEIAENRRRILADMLPLADHLDLALQHTPETKEESVSNFISNIEATRRAFLETLRRYGVERIDPLGLAFDPNLHEAIGQAPSSTIAPDHVAQVLQAGYINGDKVLRPARVLVSTGNTG